VLWTCEAPPNHAEKKRRPPSITTPYPPWGGDELDSIPSAVTDGLENDGMW
jgi:hypothetical protein